MNQLSPSWSHAGLLTLALLLGCSGETPPPAKAPEAPKEGPVAVAPVEGKLNPAELMAASEPAALVPSPAEMQKALTNAGIDAKLTDLVQDRDIKMDSASKDQIAVRTGVVLADVVLTVKTAPKAQLVARLGRLKEGFTALGAGPDLINTITGITEAVNNDAVSRDDLLKDIDELSGILVPELTYEAGDWVVPLIQAGSWLEGSHLVASALIASKKYDPAATGLLRQPAVVDHFTKYVNREGKDKAPDQVVARLNETLATLKTVAEKETLVEADIATVQSATGAVLSMLN